MCNGVLWGWREAELTGRHAVLLRWVSESVSTVDVFPGFFKITELGLLAPIFCFPCL